MLTRGVVAECIFRLDPPENGMPMYQLHFRAHDTADVAEGLDAVDDDEARSLTELRLLMTPGLSAVTLMRSGVEILRLHRDGQGHGSGATPHAGQQHLPLTEAC